MSLELNLSTEDFKEFYGRNTEQMPKLVAEGRVPLSVSGLMQRRLDVKNSDADVKSFYMGNYFDTGDAVVNHPDGRVKIVLDSQYLRDMTPETPRYCGSLVLTPEQYNSMDGEEFKKSEFRRTGEWISKNGEEFKEGKLEKIGVWISKKEVKNHPVLRVLARDQALLNDYTDYIFAEGKERFGYDIAIGIFTGSINGDTPEMMAWCVNNLMLRSNVHAGSLDIYDRCLVGVAPQL